MVLQMTRPSQRKSGVFEYRKVVPLRLRPTMGKREVKVSLGTKDPAEAKRLHAIVAAEVDADWQRRIEASLRPPVPKLTQQQIVALSGKLYAALIEEHGDDPGPPEAWAAKLRDIQMALPDRHRTSKPSSFFKGGYFTIGPQAMRLVGSLVSALLAREGLSVEWDCRVKLCMEGATAVAQAYRELEKRAYGDFRPDPDGERFPVWQPPREAKATNWRRVFDLYLASAKPAPSSVKRQRGVLEKFFAFLGHEDMKAVTDDDAERWVEHRLTVVKGSTVRDADLAHPRTLFRWAKRKKHIAHSPFEDVKIDVIDEPKLREREFDQDEAERILRASLAPVGKGMTEEGAAARRWIPWICAYTGARVNEISQLRALDVKKKKSQNGSWVWCIDITPEAGSVKTGIARLVPLHPHLVEQGFLDFAKSREGRHLFYDPSRARGGSSASPQYKKVGERLARWVRKKVGITDVGVDPNHGWRHLFRSSMLAADVQEQIINSIDGHAGKTVGQRYGTAWPQVSLAAISKIPPYRVGGV